ncbi:MAG: MATE family efflux transporter, partial [Subdoligranulum sp.]|nr:MATE family efflux transporter [Subdoligranulum sp.]
MSKDRIQLSDHFTTNRLLRFVASPIIMMIFTSVYSVVDGFFISNFAGKTAFSALNLIYPFLQAFGCLGFMVGTGGSALVAMTLGTGDKKQANNLFSMLAASTMVMGTMSTVIGWFLLEPAARLLGATPELLPNCLLYGRILLVFQTAFMMQFFFQSFFITAEKPKLGLAFTVLAGCTNIVLDFVLVGVLRGGVVGAAAATVISQLVGGIGPMLYFSNRKNTSLLHFVRPKFSAKALGKACANGSSELMTNLSASLVSALYNLQLMKLIGADGVAAYGVLMYVGFIFAAVFIGYAQGCAPIVSYHYGADNHDELKNLFRKSLTLLAIAGVAMFASAQLLATPLA